MALHDTPELALAIEIDGATGCVTAAMAMSSLRNTALDACVASAASRALFEPKSVPQRKLVRISWRPTDQQALNLEGPQQLVPVHSRCPSPHDAATRELPTREEIRAAHDRAAAAVFQCMGVWEHRPGQAFTFNVHAPTGQVVGAAMVQEPRSARVDACVADALATTCFVPFEAPKETYPFWSVRLAFPRRPEPRVPVTRCSVPRTEKNAQPTARELAEAFALVRADVQRCMADHGIKAPLYLDVNVHGPTGRIADANLEATPKNTRVHACIDRALTSWCIAPFVASDASEPYLKLRLPFIPAGYGSTTGDGEAEPQ
jgi:hypothetical protein